MDAKHTDASAGFYGSGPGIPAINTSKKQPTAAAGPGPSTVAAAAVSRKHGRKVPATGTMPVIELTDSENDDEDEERIRKRTKNTAMVVSRTPLRPGRATKLTSTSSTSSRRAAATGPKAVHAHVGGFVQGAGKDKDGEKATATVPLFLDDEGQRRPIMGGVVGDITDKAEDLPLAPQSDAHGNEEQALAAQDEDVLMDEQVHFDLSRVSIPPLPPLPQREHPQHQHHDLAQDQEQQQPTITGDDDASPYSVEAEIGEDIITKYMAQILEILPDVDPDYLIALLLQLHPQHQAETMNVALTMLFDDPKHPKVDRTGKGKRKSDSAEDFRPAKKVKLDYVDYSSQDRELKGGHHYLDLTVEHLQISFPYIPRTYLRKILTQHHMLYAPTHIYCVQLYKQHQCSPKERSPLNAHFPFLSRKTPYKPLLLKEINDAEFEKEKRWVDLYDSVDGDMTMVRVRFMAGDDAGEGEDEEEGKGKGKEKATDDEEDDDGDDDYPEGEGIECGCCFTEYSFEKMIQCPEAHLFCRSCMKTYASNLLGSHDIRLKCIHQSGCTLLFPESELRRVLPQKLIDLYDRLKQKKEIEDADLEGLEECPFCDYKCVIEVDKTQEKLFRCGNFDGGCGAISCRECKRLDHLPRSCKEMDQEKVLNSGQHAIEEAMSAALMRSCPKCKKPFVKESGCNKITCYTCSTTSCYVCRKVITGYDHFDQRPPGTAGASTSNTSSKKCPLWEPVETRHAQEVRDAAAKALADFKADHPDVDHDGIKVDVPKAVEAPRPGAQANPNLLRPPVLLPPVRQIVHMPNDPILAAAARGRNGRRGQGRARAQPRVQAQPQPQPQPHLPQPPPAQPVQPMDPLLRLGLGVLAQPVLPPMPAVAFHHHHHHHHIPAPAGMWQQNPPQAVHHPFPGGVFGQVPPLPMAAAAAAAAVVPQAQVFGFHFPANLDLNPAMQVQQPQQNLLPLRQNPPRRGRYMPPQPQPPPNINMNANPDPIIQVQAQNQPVQRRRTAWR